MIMIRRKVIKFLVSLLIIILLLLAFLPRSADEEGSSDDDTPHFDLVGNANGYRNSDSLREKLRPKLAGNFLPSKKKSSSVLWDDIGAAHNADDVKLRDEGYKMYAFNTLVSSRLSLHREIPDTRHRACRNLTYPTELPKASVIICFYREDTSTLLRTIHSVIDRSPPQALKEVILVNDQTDIDIIPNITNHIASQKLSSKVTLLHAPERLGLIRARIYGAKHATGDVLVFLDSHVEANVHWLEPLLQRIKEDKTNVVTPIIDIVNADTFKYEPSPLVRGGMKCPFGHLPKLKIVVIKQRTFQALIGASTSSGIPFQDLNCKTMRISPNLSSRPLWLVGCLPLTKSISTIWANTILV